MMLSQRLGASVLALLALSFPVLAHAALELTIEVTTTVDLSEADKAAGHASAKPRTESAVVVLGPSYFSYTTTAVRLIYDFAGRRVYTVDPATSTYTNDSLYADIGFRNSDFNRRIAAGEFKADPLQRAIMEQRYSLQDPAEGVNEVIWAADGRTVWYWKGHDHDYDLITFLFPLCHKDCDSPEIMAAFIRFFRYRFGGHPKILDFIQFQQIPGIEKLTVHYMPKIPGDFQFFNYDAGRKKTIKIDIKSRRELPDVPYSLTGLALSPDADARIDDINAANSDPAARASALLELGTTYYTSGNTLSAWTAWDAARTASPTAPGLKTVDEIQQKLVTDHPEFF